MTAGTGGFGRPYPERFFEWIQDTFPNPGHKFKNSGMGGTTACMFTVCTDGFVRQVGGHAVHAVHAFSVALVAKRSTAHGRPGRRVTGGRAAPAVQFCIFKSPCLGSLMGTQKEQGFRRCAGIAKHVLHFWTCRLSVQQFHSGLACMCTNQLLWYESSVVQFFSCMRPIP